MSETLLLLPACCCLLAVSRLLLLSLSLFHVVVVAVISKLLLLLLVLLAVIKRTAGMRKPIFKVALRVVRLFNSRHTHTQTPANTCTHTHVYPEHLIVFCMCVCVVHIEALYRKAAIKIVVAAQGKPYAVNWHDTLTGSLHGTLHGSLHDHPLPHRSSLLPQHTPAPAYRTTQRAARSTWCAHHHGLRL